MHAALWEAVRAGLVLGIRRAPIDSCTTASRRQLIRLIPEDLRAEAHLRIGRLLAAQTPPEKREETIFEIVSQLNRGAALITSREERERLAELNLIAGKRAKASTAYGSALTIRRRSRRCWRGLLGACGTSSSSRSSCTGPNASS